MRPTGALLDLQALLLLVSPTSLLVAGDVQGWTPSSSKLRGGTRDIARMLFSEITSMELMNHESDQRVTDLIDGGTYYLDDLGGSETSFTVRALVSGPVGSVAFGLDGTSSFRTESSAPYLLCGDSNGNLLGCYGSLNLGQHTVTATPYSGGGASGQAGVPLTLTFTILEGGGEPDASAPPTKGPTDAPTESPTKEPTLFPTRAPSGEPTPIPTKSATDTPTEAPTTSPTLDPTLEPTLGSAEEPTLNPTEEPTVSPSEVPTIYPTTSAPTSLPTTSVPTAGPTEHPTTEPTTGVPTELPTENPTNQPTVAPTLGPTSSPTTSEPSSEPTTSSPTMGPIDAPTSSPSISPTPVPSTDPTKAPTTGPTTSMPTDGSTQAPSVKPTTLEPTATPTPGSGIVGFVLIHAPTNSEIMTLTDGTIVNMATLGVSDDFNIKAINIGNEVQSVSFSSPGKNENVQPFAYCGDSGGNYNSCENLKVGQDPITVSVTPYPQSGQNGNPFPNLTVSFWIVDGTVAPTPLQVPTTDFPSAALVPGTTPPSQQPVEAPTQAPTLPSPGTLAPVPVGPEPTSTAPTPLPLTTAPTTPVPGPPDSLPWIETFVGIPNGAQSDGGATAWTATRSGGTFVVQSGEFVVNDGGSEGVLTTPPIQIAGRLVDVSLDLRSQGGLETNQDYVRVFVQVDGGNEVLIGEKVGVQSTPTSISGTGISGNTLILVVRAYVSFNDEFYFMDNLSVVDAGPVPPPTPVPTQSPTTPRPPTVTPPLSLNGSWQIFQNQNIDGRHEACFVMAGDKAYLIGGRESQDVDVFDPVSRSWSKGGQAPDLLHHMQCVSVGGKIYLAAAWTGFFPQEDNSDVMWVYNTATDQWESEAAIPEPRRRGSAAVVVDGTKIWVSHGNRGGHEQNNFATSYGWIDYYDTVSKTWVLGNEAGFPDAPNPRDHTGGALVNGRICVTGGRDGGLSNWPSVSPTDCFDPISNTWSVEASIPDDRSGSAYGTSCDGKLLVAGGERGISSRVDVFDGQNWSTFANGLIDSRHGTGLAVDCVRNLIYIASGAPNNGGGNVNSLEIYTP